MWLLLYDFEKLTFDQDENKVCWEIIRQALKYCEKTILEDDKNIKWYKSFYNSIADIISSFKEMCKRLFFRQSSRIMNYDS